MDREGPVLGKTPNGSSTQTLLWIALIKPGQNDTAAVRGIRKVNSNRQTDKED